MIWFDYWYDRQRCPATQIQSWIWLLVAASWIPQLAQNEASLRAHTFSYVITVSSIQLYYNSSHNPYCGRDSPIMIRIFGIIMLPLLVLGIFGNINIITATFINKTLHHRSGTLIAIVATLNLVSFIELYMVSATRHECCET